MFVIIDEDVKQFSVLSSVHMFAVHMFRFQHFLKFIRSEADHLQPALLNYLDALHACVSLISYKISQSATLKLLVYDHITTTVHIIFYSIEAKDLGIYSLMISCIKFDNCTLGYTCR